MAVTAARLGCSGAVARDTAISGTAATARAAGLGRIGGNRAGGASCKACTAPGTGSNVARGAALTSRTFTGIGALPVGGRPGKLSHSAALAWMPTDSTRAAAMRAPDSPPMA